MKIGVFGGAFNPVHNGHLSLVGQYVSTLKLDKVVLVPTCVPPHKSGDSLVGGEDRIAMLNLAVGNSDVFVVDDLEFHREGKSYTYDTLLELKEKYKGDELYLIIGSDQYFYFQNWYRADEILNMVTVVTSAREENEYNSLLEHRAKYENMKSSIVSNLDVIEVSSSQIRDLLSKGESIEGLVPNAVEEYIKEHRLYV